MRLPRWLLPACAVAAVCALLPKRDKGGGSETKVISAPAPTPASPSTAAPASPAASAASGPPPVNESLVNAYIAGSSLEWMRDDLNACNSFLKKVNGEVDAAIADLAGRRLGGVDGEAVRVARACLSCAGQARDACWDLAAILHDRGQHVLITSEELLNDDPTFRSTRVTGKAREKSRGVSMKKLRDLAGRVPSRCAAHPGEHDTDLNDAIGDLNDMIAVLDPPDFNLADAVDVLDASAECSENRPRYLALVNVALDRAKEEPEGRRLRLANEALFPVDDHVEERERPLHRRR